MPKEIYIVLGAVIGAIAAYITARITIKNQVRIAELNVEKDLRLQNDRLFDERLKAEVAKEREELKKLHLILSRVALETSQTMSYIQSDNNMKLNEFRERYLENCHRLHEAQAISDIFYPEMSESIREIYSQSNIFWGHQEGVLRTDIKENRQGWQSNLDEVLKSGKEVSNRSRNLQHQISKRSKELNNALHLTC